MAEGTVITIITVKYVENVSVSSSFHCRLISERHTSVASGGLGDGYIRDGVLTIEQFRFLLLT